MPLYGGPIPERDGCGHGMIVNVVEFNELDTEWRQGFCDACGKRLLMNVTYQDGVWMEEDE